MKTNDLIYISMSKLKDALYLLVCDNKRYEGACYNAGYCIECLIKYIFLKELKCEYYNKDHFRKFKSNYNKLSQLKKCNYEKQRINTLEISKENKELLNLINDKSLKYDMNNLEKDIEELEKNYAKM